MNRQASDQYAETAEYCRKADMRLSRDPVGGYWLHYDQRMRFVRLLSEVRGVVDWINP